VCGINALLFHKSGSNEIEDQHIHDW